MTWDGTNIRWTDNSWNPVHGCSKVSEGCRNCYAERVSHRFENTELDWTIENAEANVQIKPHKLDELDSLPDPCWVFVNSMSDLFHPLVSDEFIEEVLGKIREHSSSCFQILTKHGPANDRSVPDLPENVILGVSVESPRRRDRLEWLRDQPATTRFVSFEPLVECIPDVDLEGIGWAIVGGESGPVRREMSPAWARNLVRACERQDVPVFFKQHSGPRPESDVELDMGDGWGRRRFEMYPVLPDGVVQSPKEFLDTPLLGWEAV